LDNGRDWKKFEKYDRKSLNCFEQIVEIWTPMILLEKTQKEVRNIVEKIYIILENT
jgi:hypothetical protein